MNYGALGFVETLGQANGIILLDRMCKAADVDFETEYTRNGGHCTIIVSGDVSAVQAAVESVRENPPCEVVASAVISGPSEETVRIIDEWKAGRK